MVSFRADEQDVKYVVSVFQIETCVIVVGFYE
jgi:hypothetical protein